MVDNLGYTIHTHNIPTEVFLAFIEGDIKNVIRTYGYKNCGLRYEDVCEKIQTIITTKKARISKPMDEYGRNKLNREWRSKKDGFLKKLFEEEGFINMCFPKKYIDNPSLYQLLSKHIEFCKEKDALRSALRKTPEYSECVKYNSWIETEKASFTSEYLRNVHDYKIQTVKKYFITKEHPKERDPLGTYRNSKLNCNLYKSPSKKHQQKPVPTASTDSPQLPTSPNVRQVSQGKDGRPMPDKGGRIEITKSDVQILPQTKPPVSGDKTSSLSNTKEDGTDNDQRDDLKAKATGPTINDQGATRKHAEITGTRAQSPEQLPELTSSISTKDSPVPKVLDPPPSVMKNQGTVSDSTPSTISAAPDTAHSAQNVPSPAAPDLSLPQSQPPAVVAVPSHHQNQDTSQFPQEPTPPDTLTKSADHGTPLTSTSNPQSSLDPGLAPSKAEASSSSLSGTSPTLPFTTTDSIAGSSPPQDSLLITISPQSTTTTTTPIVTTPAIIQTTPVMSGPATVSARGTKVIPGINGITSTTEGHGKSQVPIKTASDSQDTTFASPKKQDHTILSHLGNTSQTNKTNDQRKRAQSPGPPADPPVDPSHGPQLPANLSTAIQIPTLSPGMSSDVSHVLHTVVTRPVKPTADNIKITTSPKYAPPYYIGTTLISNTPSPKVTYPSEKPSIEPTEFPALINIIPTTLILLATLTILFLLYKYTPFGLFLGRRRRKKKDLRTVFEIPEESTYESPNETIHEWDDHLGKQIMENDVYVKLLKINRYKKEMQKKKKKRDTTLIEIHMEILEECKNDEWELHKGDFLEICLQEFMNEKNRTETNWPNAELTVNNTKNDKIIQDAEENEILWNFWMDNYRNILESWKSEEWFQSLKNEWKKERQKKHNKIDEIEENTLKESGMISIEFEKAIWKKWISKQATLIENFKQEDWFKSLIAEQDKEEDNYEINEYINVLNTNMNEFEKEKKYHEFFRKKNIINKLMVQMHMMVLEECKKEEIIENKELCIDNYIQSIHKKNNYDEKSNIL
ncbi:STP1 protein [Plasmodium ovale wallikeri]|uniref:STP1 protein n=1 Tax=Plasmodium ovale wallikeri TaxID=864142 RepID=A0A1A9AT98_PLAOA|nr:STP1 protein [Plasmodium ovale wallikeri]